MSHRKALFTVEVVCQPHRRRRSLPGSAWTRFTVRATLMSVYSLSKSIFCRLFRLRAVLSCQGAFAEAFVKALSRIQRVPR
ncbi:hypothetical protein J8273_1590 [Carpediemonas membranifera]|uniref:Uncharacterized protein n=1 Tax=Carpediemonas membranifera TaxID=201153 RepID=A0A8J6E484_9EUKA|nr:hypothetical protein J8273_1590 [Carpediemonas membranifera]|eukprot:KAG9396581.1 hypothetical protein J8273_1590 [Carpediemonas membranifera]